MHIFDACGRNWRQFALHCTHHAPPRIRFSFRRFSVRNSQRLAIWLVRQTQVITHQYSVHTVRIDSNTRGSAMPMSQCNRSTCVDFNTCNFHSHKEHESYLIVKCYAVGRLHDSEMKRRERMNVEYHVAPINDYSIVQMLLPLHGKRSIDLNIVNFTLHMNETASAPQPQIATNCRIRVWLNDGMTNTHTHTAHMQCAAKPVSQIKSQNQWQQNSSKWKSKKINRNEFELSDSEIRENFTRMNLETTYINTNYTQQKGQQQRPPNHERMKN